MSVTCTVLGRQMQCFAICDIGHCNSRQLNGLVELRQWIASHQFYSSSAREEAIPCSFGVKLWRNRRHDAMRERDGYSPIMQYRHLLEMVFISIGAAFNNPDFWQAMKLVPRQGITVGYCIWNCQRDHGVGDILAHVRSLYHGLDEIASRLSVHHL